MISDRLIHMSKWPASARTLPIAMVVFLLLACWVAPIGVWSPNEQHYLWLAMQWSDATQVPKDTALMGGMPHAYLFLSLAGGFLNFFGESAGQAILRVLAASFYAYAVARIATTLGLRAIEAGLSVLVFTLVGQGLFAGEWLFDGIEPKVLAYPCVMLALPHLIEKRYVRSVMWLVAASHLHLIVGGIWTAVFFMAALLEEPDWRRLVRPAGAYAAAVVPLLLYISIAYHDPGTTIEDGTPAGTWIQAFIRYPHHSDLYSGPWQLAPWLPGIAALGPIVFHAHVLSCAASDSAARMVARLVTVGGLYLGACLLLGIWDRTGAFISLTPFRASSLLLFWYVLLLLTVLRNMDRRHFAMLVIPGFAVVLGVYLAEAMINRVAIPMAFDADRRRTLEPLWEYVRLSTAEDSIFAVNPNIEDKFLDFERRTERAMLVVFKFIPGRSTDVQEWYRRKMFRTSLFEQGCPSHWEYRVDFIIGLPTDAETLSTCGRRTFSNDQFVVVRVGTVDK